MEQFKKAQVIILPTENETEYNQLELFSQYNNLQLYKGGSSIGKPLHLYIISDDEIKEGDWFIHHSHKITTLLKAIKVEDRIFDNQGSSCCKSYCRKIIATTDTSLEITNRSNSDHPYNLQLPQPSQEFIEKYIEESNKGNIITDVLVEYENLKDEAWRTYLTRPKINIKDNTITIKKVKDSWNKEEVSNLIKSFANNYQYASNDIGYNKWIEENL